MNLDQAIASWYVPVIPDYMLMILAKDIVPINPSSFLSFRSIEPTRYDPGQFCGIECYEYVIEDIVYTYGVENGVVIDAFSSRVVTPENIHELAIQNPNYKNVKSRYGKKKIL